ncbi:MAG: helix-turn-helix domain-containing protein [Candidatus Roizmanbacteria bacterium]|nr:helix-turn-helix domain-containing protein [Candidatus Roizmanbacteria bacterium]MCR4312988.1 helix-turn-helix domain-containing protein [Candidatus Roizmanbacteria bacterium]
MTKIVERRKVITLRKEGKTFSEIRGVVKVSKSTLSIWLKPYPLSNEQVQEVNKMKYRAIEKFRETMRKKRNKRLEKYYKEIKNKLLPLSNKNLYIAGLFLYWGEGNKASSHTISINNTDPSVLKFAKYWYLNALNIKEKKMKISLHLYKDMNILKEINYWSRQLHIPKSQFIRPYIKESKKSDIDQKGFGHGTCALVVHDTVIKEKIIMGIQSVADYYSKKINSF